MRRSRPGFSAVEMLLAVLVLGVVSGAASTLFYSNTFGAYLSGDQSTAMADVQKALRSIAVDQRPGAAFATPTHTGGVRVTFSSGSPVEYYQSGATLYKLLDGTTPTTTTVVTGLTSGSGLSLTYYDSNMTAIAGPMTSTKYSQAAVVDVAVSIKLSHSSFGQVTRTTRVVLRNDVS